PKDARLLKKLVKSSIETGRPYNLDLKVKLPSNKTSYFHIMGKPIKPFDICAHLRSSADKLFPPSPVTATSASLRSNPLQIEPPSHQATKPERMPRSGCSVRPCGGRPAFQTPGIPRRAGPHATAR
ncbi:MAG: hypothetical protein R6V12_01545, partial [Candidatus Hydrogenedentota bacterium]